jgi:hypothetical protein
MSVAQIERFSAKELAEWRAYDHLDPIGGYRQDIQTAFMAYLAYGDKAKHSIEDFLVINPNPMSREQQAQADIEQQKLRLERQTAKLVNDLKHVNIKGA